MDFVLSALDYLLGIPILGWGVQVGFVYKALLLLVALLVFTAFVLLADRKIWAAAQVRRGPNVVGPFGLLQSFADLLKFVFKEPVIPAGSDKVVFLLAPGQHQCRHPLYLRHFLARCLRHHHGRLGVEQ
jgi:NADH-quinone oxidoreductase subunit H